jgi:teichuronic acid biosynthesis glycosyltransferase TuaC
VKIAVVTSLYPTPARPFEGVFAARRWEGMQSRGHAVRIVHPLPFAPLPFGKYRAIARAPRREVRAGLEIVRPRHLHVPGRPRGNAQRFARRALVSLEAGERPDVVVCDYAWPASALAPLLRHAQLGPAGARLPCVVNGRGSDVLQVAGEARLGDTLADNLRASDGWCAVSQDLVDRLDQLAADGRHGRLVPNGVDMQLFAPGDRLAARRALELPVNARIVLVVGHLIERKDPLLALEAFRSGTSTDSLLVFVGRGPLEAALVARAGELGLGARVVLTGERPPEQLRDWYRAADVLLLTSRREGRPNVVLEALATGTPVVATAAGGTGELLQDPRWLAQGREPETLGALLAAVLNEPPSAAELRRLVEPLSWTASLETLERFLSEVVIDARSKGGAG